jgi:O-acetyl-ADP-ribose deacetylase (regulator of RNase III)
MASETCFVIMPFGEKPDVDGTQVDFDEVYEYLIDPAVRSADLEPVRCDKIAAAGWIHSKMIRHVFDAQVAVVDITTLNANVFYELGVRHALRPSVTVLIRRKGTRTPFNIEGFNTIDYDPSSMASVAKAKEQIRSFIWNGMHSVEGDSLVHEVLDDLRIATAPKIAKKAVRSYRLQGDGDKCVSIITGDIQNIKGIDVWVNSENTYMQMARFFDRSVSSVIRYLGATVDEAGHILEDTIADQLTKAVSAHSSVFPAAIIVTGAGRLADTHGVKKIFHAAAAIGEVGKGYVPIPNVADCVTNALVKADSTACEKDDLHSILFPLMGTGTAQGDLQKIVGGLIDAAVDYLTANPESRIEQVSFVAWSEAELLACQAVLDHCDAVALAT